MATVPASSLKETVVKAAATAAGKLGGGEAMLAGYDERSGQFEFDVRRSDGQVQAVTVSLVLETFMGRPA